MLEFVVCEVKARASFTNVFFSTRVAFDDDVLLRLTVELSDMVVASVEIVDTAPIANVLLDVDVVFDVVIVLTSSVSL